MLLCRSFPRSLFLLAGLTAALAAQDPSGTYPLQPPGTTPITVMDCKGRYVGRLLPQKRYWVPLDRIPGFLRQALLAVEDARFYEHGGIDLRGIARALVKDVSKGRLAEGGSTITQQLIKNKFLSSERSLDRKVQEARMAMDFEKQYSKNQILEMYFNEIYFGNGAWGLVQASRLYFNKSPEALTEAECVALAGVPKNPSRYNPMASQVPVAERRDVVLKRMEDLQIITPRQRQTLREHPASSWKPGQAPQYLAAVRTALQARYGADVVERGGLDVFAALDLDLQKQAERALKEGVRRLSPDLQGALVCMDPATGDVLAAVGEVDGNADSINRAFVSRRQPGSSIKALLYTAALEKGIAEDSVWSDAPVAYPMGGGDTWKPKNYGGEQFGDLSLREALAHSSNVVAVKVLDTVGVPAFVDFAGRMGIALKAQSGLSLALGTDEVTLKDLVQAYTPLASIGTKAEARTILRIHDLRAGTWTECPPALTPVLAPEVALASTRMLQDVLVYGTAKGLKGFAETHPSAGKTGTTDNFQDAWFVGYTPHLLTGVWVGHDRPRPEGRGFTGGAIAAPIWERFMGRVLKEDATDDFQLPAPPAEPDEPDEPDEPAEPAEPMD
jgi:1A family penicillin-binding protein